MIYHCGVEVIKKEFLWVLEKMGFTWYNLNRLMGDVLERAFEDLRGVEEVNLDVA